MRKVGIRYCGGCNSRYDRGSFVKRIVEKHPDLAFEIAKEGCRYDYLLVVGGCSSCCAAYEQFNAEKIIKNWEDLDDILFYKL